MFTDVTYEWLTLLGRSRPTIMRSMRRCTATEQTGATGTSTPGSTWLCSVRPQTMRRSTLSVFTGLFSGLWNCYLSSHNEPDFFFHSNLSALTPSFCTVIFKHESWNCRRLAHKPTCHPVWQSKKKENDSKNDSMNPIQCSHFLWQVPLLVHIHLDYCV